MKSPSSQEQFIRELLKQHADIEVNGPDPWDIQVHDARLYARVIADGSLGLGEAYMDGWWDCVDIPEFLTRVLRARLDEKLPVSWASIWMALKAFLFNMQSKTKAWEVNHVHYDLDNDLYQKMLDPRMVYTCGYWESGAKNLAQAQEAKLDLICRKIGLKAGQTVLDIGCGFGSFAKFAAEKYGAIVTGITLSKEQRALGQEMCKGLPVELRLQDYRDVQGRFDHIVSIGMFEAVGHKNFREYMEVAHRCLKDGGVFLLHTIGHNFSATAGDPWLMKYIFPNGLLPSIAQIGTAIENLFVMEDWHNFGLSYEKTLHCWHQNFLQSWDSLKQRYDERFKRMWMYYLLSCAGAFRSRTAQLWQIVLTKDGLLEGYRRPVDLMPVAA
jgi:cyclopropane-fatty-acyl-phospholipid synthase